MKKNFILALLALLLSSASYAQTPLSGSLHLCTGATVTAVEDSTYPGGTWSSSNTSVATVTASIYAGTVGMVTGVSAGVATITYTLGSSYVTETVTVNVGPTAISGAGTPVCVGSSITLADAVSGGVWSSSGSDGSVSSTTGVVTGVHGGSTVIYYTLPTGCFVDVTVTVNSVPTVIITGPTTVCVGSTITLADTSGITGGVWTSGTTSVATVSSVGVVAGVSAGTATITYAVTDICGTTDATRTITVTSTTSPGTISGASTVASGSSITLSDAVSGGTWSTSSSSIATVSSAGVVTGVSTGSVTITYTVTGCSGPAYVTYSVTVTAFDGISGHVNFTGASYYGLVKVYLITYNPSTYDLEAMDSATYSCAGTSVFYQFTGVATDSYRVKAAVYDSLSSTTGYIPTYHTSQYYWHDADVINHISGTSDINEDINMTYGTATTGPGFIGGSVLTGANRGTSTSVPAVDLTIYLVNSATGHLIAQTQTDVTGAYSFSNLPVGQTYFVFPHALNYLTTAYSGIALTTANPSLLAASFIQHTVSFTITPIDEAVKNVNAAVSSISMFPNPTNGKLSILWNENTTEKGNVTISDITGRVIYTTTLQMNQGSGMNQVDLSGLNSGLYLISITTASINYTNKIQILH